MTKEARAKVITTGLENPTPDVSKAIMEAEAAGKGRCFRFLHFINNYKNFNSHPSLSTSIILNTLYVFSDADKEPADNLTKLAAIDVDDLLSQTRGISEGVMFNVQQSLLKEWGPDFLGVLLEDTMEEMLTGVTLIITTPSHHFLFLTHLHLFSSITCFSPIFFHFQGLHLLELAAHLEQKAAQLKCKGLG